MARSPSESGANQPNHEPFNPLDKRNLGESVLRELLRQPVLPMPPPREVGPGGRRYYNPDAAFQGAGVYAIYYVGEHQPFDPYEPLADVNRGGRWERPIYVGKADPRGSRSGQDLNLDPGEALFQRLTQHSESIDSAENLDLRDFAYRALRVDDAFIGLGEIVVIQQLRPLWNSVGQGFGSKVVGAGRSNQKRSRWDTLHPGRPGMGVSDPRMPLEQVAQLVRSQLAGQTDVPAEAEDASTYDDT